MCVTDVSIQLNRYNNVETDSIISNIYLSKLVDSQGEGFLY